MASQNATSAPGAEDCPSFGGASSVHFLESFEFFAEGVTVVALAVPGIVGNLGSSLVLSQKGELLVEKEILREKAAFLVGKESRICGGFILRIIRGRCFKFSDFVTQPRRAKKVKLISCMR